MRKSKGQQERESRQYHGIISPESGNVQLVLNPNSRKAQRKRK